MIKLEDLEPGHSADPYALYSRLRDTEPIVQVELLGLSCWLVTGYDAVRDALANPSLSNDAELASPVAKQHPFVATEAMLGVGRHMLRSDPPQHTRLRRFAEAAFTTQLVEHLAARARATVESRLRELAAADEVELVRDLALPVATSLIMDVLGVAEADRPDVSGWLLDTASTNRDDGQRIMQAYTALLGHFGTAAGRLRNGPVTPGPGDLLGAMSLGYLDGERLSSADLAAMAYLLFAAGHRPTVYLLSGALLNLLSHPDTLAVLRADRGRIPAAVEELVRFDGPMAVNMRFTTEDVTIGGHTLPGGGEPVLIALSSANRDPAKYPKPDLLDLDRQSDDHLTFGHGVHACLGARLARRVAAETIDAVLDHCPGLQLAVATDDVEWLYSAHLRGPLKLPVTLP